MWPWNTKPVLSRLGIFVAIVKNALCESKLSILFYEKNPLGYQVKMFHEDI